MSPIFPYPVAFSHRLTLRCSEGSLEIFFQVPQVFQTSIKTNGNSAFTLRAKVIIFFCFKHSPFECLSHFILFYNHGFFLF